MAGRETMKTTCRVVKPLMSTDFCEARRRAIGLYRAFYRYIPYIHKYFDIPKSESQIRSKIREQFYKNACVTDIRIIDILVMKECITRAEVKFSKQPKLSTSESACHPGNKIINSPIAKYSDSPIV
ncbi:hypothetical protein evm_014530 [Chilo suppressalis]|nr:hypothetical protein evm_014530 [Chilo suppressalis]